MKAKEHPRIRVEGRTKLQDVIPLDTPLHVFIDPSAACNFKCGFCFHADPRNRHHEIMSWDTFTRTIGQLKQFPRKLKAVRLYGFGEPLLNKRLPEMVQYTKEAGVTDFVEFTTNGWWLEPALNRRLVDAGLDAITISVPGLSDTSIQESCGKAVDFKSYVSHITDFYLESREKCRVHVKVVNAMLKGKEDKQFFYNLFGDICDEISIDNVVPIWPYIDGKCIEDKSIYRGEIKPVRVCPYIFYHLTIHASGEISTCFVDWNHDNILGNIATDTLVDIWNGERLRALRINMLEGYRFGICETCPQLIYGEPDNIDKYAKELEGRFL